MATSQPRYSVFLSYNRGDGAAAQRIQRWLETYRLPRRLAGGGVAFGDDGHRLRPVFRDLDEMRVAPDLDEAVAEAIGASAWMVVLCSPSAAKSEWVGHEIELFRARHGDDRILPLLLEGTPATSFPPALLHRADGRPLVPLAADIPGEGERLALLKLVAVMAGISMAVLVQRDAQRRMQRLALAAALALSVMAIVAALAVTALRSRQDAERQSARAGEMSAYMLEKMRANLKRYGDVGMLAQVNRGVMESFRGRDLAGLSDGELQQLAKLRLAMGEDAEQRGDIAEASRQIVEASRTTAARLAAAPDDVQRIFDHAQSQYFVGLIDWRTGNRAGAEAAFRRYRALARQLVSLAPDNPDWVMEVGYSEQNLGMYALRSKRDTAAAERHFGTALAAFLKADRLRPGTADTVSAISDVHAWLGDSRRLRGDFDGALASRAEQRRLLETRRAADPRDRQVQADLVSNDLAIARIAEARGDWRSALVALDRGQAAAQALASEDPANVKRASQVRIFDLFRLRVWLGLPPGQRPPAAILAKTNGNCRADKEILKSNELGEYCAILAAWRLGTNVPVAVEPADILSDRWGLDFARERALATASAR